MRFPLVLLLLFVAYVRTEEEPPEVADVLSFVTETPEPIPAGEFLPDYPVASVQLAFGEEGALNTSYTGPVALTAVDVVDELVTAELSGEVEDVICVSGTCRFAGLKVHTPGRWRLVPVAPNVAVIPSEPFNVRRRIDIEPSTFPVSFSAGRVTIYGDGFSPSIGDLSVQLSVDRGLPIDQESIDIVESSVEHIVLDLDMDETNIGGYLSASVTAFEFSCAAHVVAVVSGPNVITTSDAAIGWRSTRLFFIEGTGFDPTPGGTSVQLTPTVGPPVTDAQVVMATATRVVVDLTLSASNVGGDLLATVWSYGAPSAFPDVKVREVKSIPRVAALVPDAGPIEGGTVMSVMLDEPVEEESAPECRFGENEPVAATWVSPTELTCVTPPGEGRVVVEVRAHGSLLLPSDDVSCRAGAQLVFVQEAPPTIASIDVTSGPVSGGTTVVLTGLGFVSTTQLVCAFGDELSPATFISTLQAHCQSPAREGPGAVDVTFSLNGIDFSAVVPAARFEYFADMAVHGVAPSYAPVQGGGDTLVTLAGAFVDHPDLACHFDLVRVPATFESSSTIVCVSPGAQEATAVPVSVSYNARDLVASPTNVTFVPDAEISLVEPVNVRAEGGTSITLTNRKSFAAGTTCAFGSDAVVSPAAELVDDATLVCVVPALDVDESTRFGVFLTLTGIDTDALGDFAVHTGWDVRVFADPVHVSSIVPSSSPASGGATLTVYGQGFVDSRDLKCVLSFLGNGTDTVDEFLDDEEPGGEGEPKVIFPGEGNAEFVGVPGGPADIVLRGIYHSSSLVMCIMTAVDVAGHYAVRVSNNGNRDVSTTVAVFSFAASVSLSSVSPNAISERGGTTVSVRGSGFPENGTTICRFAFLTQVNATWITPSVVLCKTPARVATPLLTPFGFDVSVNDGFSFSTPPLAMQYYSEPVVASVEPVLAMTGSRVNVTISGNNFANVNGRGACATVGAGAIVELNAERLVCTLPPSSNAGFFPLEITNNGFEWTTSGLLFQYYTPPTITAVTPLDGPTNGGTSVSLLGSGFLNRIDLACRFGQTVGPASFISSTYMLCTTPSRLAGSSPVEMTNSAYEWVAYPDAEFLFKVNYHVEVVRPAAGGPYYGGKEVSVLGRNFAPDPDVTCRFAETADVLGRFVSASKVVCTTPSVDPGVWTVRVSMNAIDFTVEDVQVPFIDTPRISQLSPSVIERDDFFAGPLAVTGRGFLGEQTALVQCLFDGFPTDATVVSDTEAHCPFPPVPSRFRRFTNVQLKSVLTYVSQEEHLIEFFSPPVIESFSPIRGEQGGGAVVTLFGSDFFDAGNDAFCKFGAAVTPVDFVNETAVTCVAPAGAGNVTLGVTFNDLHYYTSPDTFEYFLRIVDDSDQTINRMDPRSGPTAGGTEILLTAGMFSEATNGKARCRFSNPGDSDDGPAIEFIAIWYGPGSISCRAPTPQEIADAGLGTVTATEARRRAAETGDPYWAHELIADSLDNGGMFSSRLRQGNETIDPVFFGVNTSDPVIARRLAEVGPPEVDPQEEFFLRLAVSPGVFFDSETGEAVDIGDYSEAENLPYVVAPSMYGYYLLPEIHSVEPKHGPQAGGSEVTVRGRNFRNMTAEQGLVLRISTLLEVEYWTPTLIFVTTGASPPNSDGYPLEISFNEQQFHTNPEVRFTFDVCDPGSTTPRFKIPCTNCTAGHYSNDPQADTSCNQCPANTYTDEIASTECKDCPSLTMSGQASQTLDSCLCQPGAYHPRGSTGKRCTECPRGAVCAGFQSLPESQPGFWVHDQFSRRFTFLECPLREACPGGDPLSCAEGYTSDLCGGCETGYYKVGLICEVCPENPESRLGIFAVLCVIAVVLFVGAAGGGARKAKRRRKQKEKAAEAVDNAKDNLKKKMAVLRGDKDADAPAKDAAAEGNHADDGAAFGNDNASGSGGRSSRSSDRTTWPEASLAGDSVGGKTGAPTADSAKSSSSPEPQLPPLSLLSEGSRSQGSSTPSPPPPLKAGSRDSSPEPLVGRTDASLDKGKGKVNRSGGASDSDADDGCGSTVGSSGWSSYSDADDGGSTVGSDDDHAVKSFDNSLPELPSLDGGFDAPGMLGTPVGGLDDGPGLLGGGGGGGDPMGNGDGNVGEDSLLGAAPAAPSGDAGSLGLEEAPQFAPKPSAAVDSDSMLLDISPSELDIAALASGPGEQPAADGGGADDGVAAIAKDADAVPAPESASVPPAAAVSGAAAGPDDLHLLSASNDALPLPVAKPDILFKTPSMVVTVENVDARRDAAAASQKVDDEKKGASAGGNAGKAAAAGAVVVGAGAVAGAAAANAEDDASGGSDSDDDESDVEYETDEEAEAEAERQEAEKIGKGKVVVLYAKMLKKCVAPAPIIISYLQLVAVMAEYPVGWPIEVQRAFNYASIFNINLDFLASDCSAPMSYERKYIIQLMLPSVFIFLFLVIFVGKLLLYKYRVMRQAAGTLPDLSEPLPADASGGEKLHRRFQTMFLSEPSKEGMAKTRRRMISAFIQFLVFAYLFLSKTALQIFDCTQIADGSYILDSNPSLKCYNEWWFSVAPYAAFFCVLYVVCIPLGLAIVFMLKYRMDEDKFSDMFGALFSKFHSKRSYWELMVMLRKIGIVLSKMFYASYPVLQILGAMFVIAGSLQVQAKGKPYVRGPFNMLDAVLLWCAFILCTLGLLFLSGNFPSPATKTVLIVAVFAVLIFSLLYSAAAMLYEAYFQWKTSRPSIAAAAAAEAKAKAIEDKDSAQDLENILKEHIVSDSESESGPRVSKVVRPTPLTSVLLPPLVGARKTLPDDGEKDASSEASDDDLKTDVLVSSDSDAGSSPPNSAPGSKGPSPPPSLGVDAKKSK